MLKRKNNYELFCQKRQKKVDDFRITTIHEQINNNTFIENLEETDKFTINIVAQKFMNMKHWFQAKKYIDRATTLNHPEQHYLLGLYHLGFTKDKTEYVKHFENAIKETNNSKAMHQLGVYYEQEKDYNKMEQYYLNAIKQFNIHSMFELGKYYMDIERNYQMMMKYYCMAIEYGNGDGLWGLGIYYLDIEKNDFIAKKYFLQCVAFCNDLDSMIKLAKIYKYSGDNENAKKYSDMALNNGKLQCNAYVELYNVYDELDDEPNKTICFNNILVLEPAKAISIMREMRMSNEKIYIQLIDKPNPSKELLSEITKLKSNHRVNSLANKINMSKKYNIIDDCLICYDNALGIMLNCGHTCCVKCYVRIDKCPMCNY